MAKNIKDLLLGATKFPETIEGKLPEGAPKISTMLADVTDKMPAVPDFPMEVPDIMAPPTLPEVPTPPALTRYVSGVEVTPTPSAPAATTTTVKKVPLYFE